jgi:hypothetical protein
MRQVEVLERVRIVQASLQTRQKDYLHWQHDEGGKGQCGVLEK